MVQAVVPVFSYEMGERPPLSSVLAGDGIGACLCVGVCACVASVSVGLPFHCDCEGLARGVGMWKWCV